MTISLDVTLRSLSLGSRDSWSGWRAKNWTTSTIEMVIVPKGATTLMTLTGLYPKLDAVGATQDGCEVGDQILDSNSEYWDIETVAPQYVGDSFVWRDCDLNKATLYQADASSTTWTLTRGSDPRYRTKVYLDTYVRSAQITKDNDSTTADWAAIFNDPPYPLQLEFRGSSNMEALYIVDNPESTPRIDALTRVPYAYDEEVPIHCMAINSTGTTGTALCHKLAAELRYVTETYPIAANTSLRQITKGGPKPVSLGGMWLYDLEYILSYTRDVAT